MDFFSSYAAYAKAIETRGKNEKLRQQQQVTKYTQRAKKTREKKENINRENKQLCINGTFVTVFIQ